MRLLISGGSSDIGRAIIERRLVLGDEVLTTSSRSEDLKFSKPVEQVLFNLNQPEQQSTELKQWISKGVDALVLNAATRNTSLRRLHEYQSDEIQENIFPNLMGNIWLLQQCLPKMIEQNFGRIVLISSIAVNGAARYSLYSATKAALESMVKSIAIDYGEFNMTANIIRPGIIETERTQRFWKRTSYVDIMRPLIPLTRFGRPVDIATACDPFLDINCYANGAVLEVSGGLPQIRPDAIFKVGL